MTSRGRWSVRALGVLCGLVLGACTGAAPVHRGTSSAAPPPAPYSAKPNIVFVLTDDLSMNLVPFMPHVRAMQEAGTSFANYTVTDSLCCPSRSSILSGKLPHNTGVYTNTPPDGGLYRFHRSGDDKATIATALKAAGYRTALMGKYLNGYHVGPNHNGFPPDYVPPGWTDWAGVDNGYAEFDYNMNVQAKIVHYGHADDDYLTRVITERGRDFINSAAGDHTPFFLELASFAPHSPFTPDPEDAALFPGLSAPRGPSFDRVPTDPPTWLAQSWRRAGFTPAVRAQIDRSYRLRVQSVQSVDRMIGSIQSELEATGQLQNTIFVFSSDNGYHLGEHALRDGKLTAFDTDIRVPLVITGPGVRAGAVRNEVVENIDLAPTFEQLAGVAVPSAVDGRSLVPLLRGATAPWRTVALVEHHGPVIDPADPDRQGSLSGNPPSYVAIRTVEYAYIRYVTGEREYYDLRRDPLELHNLGRTLTPAAIHGLDATLAALSHCRGALQCWSAARVT